MSGNYVTPPYITYSIPFFLIFLLFELFLYRNSKQHAYRLNDTITNLTMGTYSQVAGVFCGGFIGVMYKGFYEKLRFADIPTNWWTGILCFLLVDFFYYWFHRNSHRVAIIWGSHEAHHQSEEYNLSVALRQGAIQTLFSAPFYIPLALMGFHPVLFFACHQFNTIYQFWIHTRSIKKMGILEWFMNTPSHHRVHHGINPQYIDKNHAGVLIIWDRLFGTFCEEKEEAVYGTVSPLASFNPIWANVRYWCSLYRLSGQVQGWKNKIRVWYMPPGWQPEEMGGPMKVPSISVQSFVKYNPLLTRPLSNVAFFQFVLITAVSLYYLNKRPSETYIDIAMAGFIIFGSLIPAALMEAKTNNTVLSKNVDLR